MALGSVRELETIYEIGLDLGYFDSVTEILASLDEIARMLTSLIHKLNS